MASSRPSAIWPPTEWRSTSIASAPAPSSAAGMIAATRCRRVTPATSRARPWRTGLAIGSSVRPLRNRRRARGQRQQERDRPGPAGLVARAQAGPVVTVEVLVERDQVVPVRIALEGLAAAEHRPAAMLVLGEGPRQAPCELGRHLGEVQLAARAGRALDRPTVAVVAVQLQ